MKNNHLHLLLLQSSAACPQAPVTDVVQLVSRMPVRLPHGARFLAYFAKLIGHNLAGSNTCRCVKIPAEMALDKDLERPSKK